MELMFEKTVETLRDARADVEANGEVRAQSSMFLTGDKEAFQGSMYCFERANGEAAMTWLAPGRSKEEILAGFDRAIALAETDTWQGELVEYLTEIGVAV